MKTNDTQNNAQHLERAPGSAAPRHQHPAHPCVCWWRGALSLQSESGEGRALEPVNGEYQIYTADDLKEFAAIVNGTAEGIDQNTSANAKLMNDIVLNEKIEVDDNGAVTNQEELSEWIPIGNSYNNAYTGIFNGNGKTIENLYINTTDSSDNDQGLFGYVGSSGKVQDLTVSGTVSGNNYVGGIAGQNGGRITDCDFTGSVTSSGNYVGGVVGLNGGTVENCHNIGEISGLDSGTSNQVGGVVGYSSGGSSASASVTNCYNTGEVSGGEDVGGVVGHTGINSSVTNCYNTGNVSGPDSVNGETTANVGGVVGSNSFSATVTNCYNTGTVTGPVSASGNNSVRVGGVVGYNSGGGNVTDCYFLKGTAEKGIGSGETTGATAVNDLNVQSQFDGWDFADTWRISQSRNRPVLQANAEDNALSGTGKQEDPYKIYRAIDLKNFRDLVNGENGNPAAWAVLMENITLNSSEEWEPIGTSESTAYTGTFDGNGHKIENLYINDSGADNQGLFGYVGSSGKVQNLSVSGSVKGNNYVGGVAGDNSGSVTNCAFSGSVNGSYVGGVVGLNRDSVENCYNTGAVNSSGNNVGGVVGWNISSGSVTNCYNTGAVNSSGNYVGGVVGQNFGGVKNCYNTGNVSDNNHVGGVVGDNSSIGTVTGCYFLQGTAEKGIGSGSGSATPRSAEAFESQESFTNWDFANTWKIEPIFGRPTLRDNAPRQR